MAVGLPESQKMSPEEKNNWMHNVEDAYKAVFIPYEIDFTPFSALEPPNKDASQFTIKGGDWVQEMWRDAFPNTVYVEPAPISEPVERHWAEIYAVPYIALSAVILVAFKLLGII